MALYTTLDEDLARLTRREKIPTIAGDSLIRRWEEIDATVADDLVTAVTGTTIATPKADKQEYAGTFARGNIRAEGQGGRQVTISESLTLFNTVTSSISTLQDLSPIKTYDNQILNNFGLHEGEKDAVAFVYSNMNPSDAQKTICMGYSDNDIASTLGMANGDYLQRSFKTQEDGTATFTIAAENPKWLNTWAADAIKMQEQSTGGYKLKELNEATGVSEANRASSFLAAQSPSDPDTRNVVMTQFIERANGERVISQTEGKVSIATGSPDLFLEIQEAVGRRERQAGRVWWRRTAAAKATLTELDSGNAAKDFQDDNAREYTHTKYEVTDNGDGSYNVYQLGTVPNASSSGYRGLKDGTQYVWETKGITIDLNGFPTSYIVIIDRLVTSDQESAMDFAAGSDEYPGGTSDYHRLGGSKWSDSAQRYISKREKWYEKGSSGVPGALNNYTGIDDDTPDREPAP